MSSRQLDYRKHIMLAETTDDYLDMVRLMRRDIQRLAGDPAVLVKVLVNPFGAPARFIPSAKEIHIDASVFKFVDPNQVDSWQDFCVKYPTEAGVVIHEILHDTYSLNQDGMDRVQKRSLRVYSAFAILDEGRIEVTGWKHRLDEGERLALRSMIINMLLKDVQDDDGENEQESDQMRAAMRAIKIVGLLTARAMQGPLDPGSIDSVLAAMQRALGDYYPRFVSLANEFASLNEWELEESGYVIATKWLELVDAVRNEIEPPSPQASEPEESEESESGECESESGEGEGEGEESESESGEGEDGESGEGAESEAESESESGEGEGEESESGESGEESGESGEGESDEGESESGEGESEGQGGDDAHGVSDGEADGGTPDAESDSDAHGQGSYGSIPEDISKILDEAIKDLNKAAVVVEDAAVKELEQVKANIVEADFNSRAEFRARVMQRRSQWK